MSSVSKGKSKANRGQNSVISPPSLRVEKPLPELPREGAFRHKVKEGLQHFFSIRPSHSRVASRSHSERGKCQEYHPVLDATANPNIGDKNRSVEIKDGPFESLKHADRRIVSTDRGYGEAIMDTEEKLLDEIVEKTARDSIDAPRQVQEKRTTGGGTPRNQSPDIGGPCPQQIARVSMQEVASHLHAAHHFTIGGNPRFENNRVKNEYYYPNHGGTYDITILKEFVSFRALYNSSAQDPTRRVHPGTRQRVLNRIRDWIDTPSAKERIFWLHGPAGVGKSAIAQTIARSCARGTLAATFFFYRSDPGRNDGNRLFTTLAWQFASTIHATKNVLIHSLNEYPDIPMTDVETQFEELIVKPFMELARSGVQMSAPVVILDGVDECSDDNLQRRFLKVIGNAVKDDRVPLRFLICSRPEAHIQDMVEIFRSVTLSLDLAELDDANQDIAKYLKAEFSRIATEQDLDPAWPGKQIIREFVYKASGQFIYASTVIKYVGDEHSSAQTQLDIILGLKPASSVSPFAELDELYKEILRRQRDPVFLTDFLSLLIGRNGINDVDLPRDDAMLMNVSEKELRRKFRGMRSLFKLEPFIDVHHRSFLDFLQDSSRSGQYHISNRAGTRRYLELIADSLARYALTVIEGHDDHKTHFTPQFHQFSILYPAKIVLPVEDWQQAMKPLVHVQNKLLALQNFHCTWEFLPCNLCTGFRTMRNLLLHFASLIGASNCVLYYTSMPESHSDGSEQTDNGIVPLIPTETDTNWLDKELNVCLSSLLHRLQRRKLGISLGTDTIQLVCSLLRFDYAEIVMRLRSMLDAQNLMDVIDELINDKYFYTNYSPDISCKAVHLALEIYTRVPVLPRSLFSKRTVGSHHDVWPTCRDSIPDTELLFQTAFMSKILDPNYAVRVSWVYEEEKKLLSVVGKVNGSKETLGQWRERSNPSSVTTIRIMLQVARALKYFHSMGIVLHNHIDSGDIFLDSEFHARFRFLGLTTHYANASPIWHLEQRWYSHEGNIFFFGCLFYEMYFGVAIHFGDKLGRNSNAVAKRPSKPEIRDDAWQLIQRCCTKETKSRPTMDEVVREMEAWDIT